METTCTGKEVDHSWRENRDYLHLPNFQARHVTTKPLFLDETRFEVFLLLLAPDLSSRIIIAWDQALQWGEKGKKRGQTGKISASDASPAVQLGRGKGHPFPSPDYLSGSLRSLIVSFAHVDFFSFFP